ncbi:MAG: SixA phosphatase family protein [Candidatus Limnocylindrales bacterium]
MADRTDRLELYLLRHADAGDPGAWTRPDAERPLSAKGHRQAERMGRHLAALGLVPDAIVSSPKIRATETAAAVSAAVGCPVVEDPRLAGLLELEDVEAVLRDLGRPPRTMLVGHDPDFSDLLSVLVGATSLTMRKGALARIDLVGPLEPGSGTLRWLIPPDALSDG